MSDKPLTDVSFSSFDLHPDLLAGLESAGFLRCTPIQALTLPLALAGRDIAGQAQTGTGKTLAFLVATIDRLLKRPAVATRHEADPRSVMIAPTRELAMQIHKDALKIAAPLGLKINLVYGGVDYDKQRDALRAGSDIIIATPGRLIDYYKQKVFGLQAVEVVVLDEADRMFDLGFIKDIRYVLRRMPPSGERQSLMFSATLSYRVLELAYEHMHEPQKLVVEAESITAARVRQLVYFPSTEEKIPLLLNLLQQIDPHRTMLFVNTKAAAERVTRRLERQGHSVATLSGDVPQRKRQSLLAKFQRGEIAILVATDVAARGLHVPEVSHVINYDLPQDAEDYVHRIGRTARLGAEGDAISFACDLYAMTLPEIEAYIEQKIPVAQISPDLLLPPPPAPRREGAAAANDAGDEDEAEDADFTPTGRRRRGGREGAPPRSGSGRSGSGAGSRSGSGGGRGERGGGRSRPAAATAAEAPQPAAAAANGEAASAAPAEPATAPGTEAAPGDAPRRRRRRRRRPAGAVTATETSQPGDATPTTS
jgi:ATP-dependent RNA helicase RhlB